MKGVAQCWQSAKQGLQRFHLKHHSMGHHENVDNRSCGDASTPVVIVVTFGHLGQMLRKCPFGRSSSVDISSLSHAGS